MRELNKIPLAEILDMMSNIDKRINDLNEYKEVLVAEVERRFPGFKEKLLEDDEEVKRLERKK